MIDKTVKTTRAVRPNRGIELKYRKALRAMVDDMERSIMHWLPAAYRKAPPRTVEMVAIAQDELPSRAIKKYMDDLGRRWTKRFDDYAPRLAEAYITHMYKHADSAFRLALKEAGWAVDFRMTKAMRDALSAQIAENVGLIKSIPEQYLSKVEGIVLRHYSFGRDLEGMVKELRLLYPAASHRAELIARDQSNKANAVVNRTRQLELGLTEAIWMHSSAGKEPRPDHIAANGKKYKIAEGCLISGEYIQPGELINCRCTSRSVLPF